MSLANPGTTTATRPSTVRQQIVAVLDDLDGITGYPIAPDQATAGAAWPRWVQTTYDGALCSLAKDTYEVLVTLPADYTQQTVDQGDGFRDVVAVALSRIAHVAYVEPAQITFADRQAMPGLRLRITTR